MFEAILFFAGAILFLLAVVLFGVTWRDRHVISETRAKMTTEQKAMAEKHVELDIWQRELQVWLKSLETEQRQLVDERQRLLMLAAPPEEDRITSLETSLEVHPETKKQKGKGKNFKA